ncbi:Peroxisomal biogenesis factor 6 [Lasiodiplodia theobromae]|uniref:Peroxisomal ATPase PEX6 n=1 Tax=Lasiodiplodia theobromae TaxID=45133 RepID=A0A5N5DAT6_9PEZI|nr:Peroxisomal biogenesis factor 6 [Lasiodiplodia theobromae]
MAVDAAFNQRRRRRRRRRQDKPAISARLLPDDRLKGEVGVLSDDLFQDLFPKAPRASAESPTGTVNRIYHVAITPWVPSSVSSPSACSWTILPVRPHDKSDQTASLPHSSLQFPAKSLALQSFAHALQSAAPTRPPRRDTPIEIRILDAVPLGLETIYVSIDADALRKLEDVKAKFGGGFGTQVKQLRPNGVQKKTDLAQQERAWRDAVRKALQVPSIVHTNDLLPLPIESHPITHQPPPPARVVSCEPVAQGLLLPSTRIVVLHSRSSKGSKRAQPAVPSPRPAGTEDEDTSNETFYSAAEDRTSSDAPSPPTDDEASTTDNLESELSASDAGDLSDDSDDMISLSAPMLPPQSSGVLSAWTSATPRAGGFQTGMMSPGAGSVYSTFTSATARGGAKGRLFKAVGLLEQIPEEMVHPKPGSDDDEEARIFVDTNTLVKVGCFSGDWVRINASEEPQGHGLGTWGLGSAFGEEEEEQADYRTVKIFGLPENMVKKTARYPVNRAHQRMSSVAMRSSSTTISSAYLSPILLANLGSPSHLRISALQHPQPSGIPKSSIQRPKVTSSSLPPFAKEVTLLKLSTPLSTDRFLQPSLFAGLKDYFEQKRRIVKSGDLVGIAVDEALGRAIYQGASPEGELGSEELLSKPKPDGPTAPSQDAASSLKSVAWFRIGKATVAENACADLGLHSFSIDSFDILTEGGSGGGDVKTEAFLKARAERALSCGSQYTALLLKHVEALNADRIVAALKEVLADSRVLIATTTEVDKVPDGIRSLFTHELDMSAPDEAEREGILRGIVEDRGIRLSADVDLSNIAVKTAALVAGDLVDVIDRALVAKNNRLEAVVAAANKNLPEDAPQPTLQDLQLAGGSATVCLSTADLTAAVDAARKNFADAIGAPKIPNVQWSDVGGLTNVKEAVTETIQLPLSRPELFARGMKKRSGILFYGPPGTGKTLLAKAIATSFSLNFFSVKGPELLNMYIGESEANVRRVFQRARDARPCVVFFDELDSVAPKRGNQGDSGGVMDRIVSQLLAELDGMSDGDGGGGGVFVIGATNRPDLLDQALLRPGRFDKMLYLGVSDTHEKQQTILEALTRKFSLHPSLSLARIASLLPFTYTGADLYALCSDAMLKAITRQANAVDAKVKQLNAERTASNAADSSQKAQLPPITTAHFFDHLATEVDTAVMVTEEDFLSAKAELVPSVSVDELRHYERVRRTFEGQAKEKEKEKAGAASGQMTIGDAAAAAAAAGQDGINGVGGGGGGKGKGKGKAGGARGKGKGKAMASGDDVGDEEGEDDDGNQADGVAEVDDDEDEYVIRTDHLMTANGSAGKGKGKAAAAEVEGGDGNAAAFGEGAEGDEDMYQ